MEIKEVDKSNRENQWNQKLRFFEKIYKFDNSLARLNGEKEREIKDAKCECQE